MTDALPTSVIADVQVDYVELAHTPIGVVAEVVKQVTEDLSLAFGDDPCERRIRAEPVPQYFRGSELEIRLVAEAPKILRELLGKEADRGGIGLLRRAYLEMHSQA